MVGERARGLARNHGAGAATVQDEPRREPRAKNDNTVRFTALRYIKSPAFQDAVLALPEIRTSRRDTQTDDAAPATTSQQTITGAPSKLRTPLLRPDVCNSFRPGISMRTAHRPAVRSPPARPTARTQEALQIAGLTVPCRHIVAVPGLNVAASF